MSDRLAARQRTERALQAASLHPSGLSRDAILVVRRLTARRAGTAGWEQAVNARLDQLARQAARPIEGAVPANAEAVIFADRSELLACLAADWCAGMVRAQWWWQSLLHHDDITHVVIDAWLEQPEYVPLALHQLAARQQAISFAQQLSDAHTHSLLNAVVQAFGLYELSVTLDEVIDHQPEGREVVEQHVGSTTNALSVQVMPAPPWQPWIQTHVEHLSPDRQVLLGVGLMLHAAPTIVRSASFASEVKAWHAAIRVAPLQQPASAKAATAELEVSHQTGATLDPGTVPSEELAATQPSLRGGWKPTKQSQSDQHDVPATDEITSQHPTHDADAHLAETRASTEVEQAQVEIETEFGGVCYFINLGLFLNLYGDFTTPLQPGLDLPIWDFMALVAQELIGDDVTRDPIWTLLAQLADRAEDEPPNVHFDPTHNVIASPTGAKQSPSSSSEIASSPTALTRPALFSGVAMTPLDSWLADLMSIIRPRLQLALGVSAAELPRYFKQHARIVISAVNFDAYFALADLPIEIRLSGLDRNPGWVPAAGRTVRFHYD
jgi:hypothetical protein